MMYRRAINKNLIDEMDRMQRDLERMFGSAYSMRRNTPASFPAINLWSSEDGAVITAEIPGIQPENIDISVVGESLTIRGERIPERPQNAQYHRQERGYGKFTRTIELPFPVNSDQIKAILQNGILKVELPRAEEDKPRKINIRANA